MAPTTSTHPTRLVELRVPAEASYVALVRLTAAGVAARASFTVDDIDDLRLAVDEACALVLTHAHNEQSLDVTFEVQEGCLRVAVSVPVDGDARLNPTGVAWTVLSALVNSVDVSNHGGRLQIELTRRRLPSYP